MRLRDTVLGTLGLFSTHVGALNDDDVDLAPALAHVASVAFVADTSLSDKAAIDEKLQHVLKAACSWNRPRESSPNSAGRT